MDNKELEEQRRLLEKIQSENKQEPISNEVNNKEIILQSIPQRKKGSKLIVVFIVVIILVGFVIIKYNKSETRKLEGPIINKVLGTEISLTDDDKMRLNFFVDDMLEYDGEKLNPILTKDTKAEELSNLILTRFVFDKLDQIKIVVGNEGDLKTAFVPEEELNSIIKEYIAIDKVNYNDTGIIYKGVRDLGFEYDFLLFKYDSLKKGFVHNYEYRSERKNLFSFYGQNADGSYCRTLTSIHLLPHPKGRTEFIVERDHIKLNIKAVIFCSYTKNNVTYEDLYADNSRKTPLVSYSYYEDPNVKKNKTFEESLAEQKRFTLFLDNGLSQVKPYTFIFNKDLRLTSVKFPK